MTTAHAQTFPRPGAFSLSARGATALVLLIWAAFALSTGWADFSGVVETLTTDDATRLVEVRDLLAGQSWFDLTLHRLNPPDGVVMHWSRLIDLPIAGLLASFSRALSPDLALKATLTVWPLLLLLPALLAVASASRTLAGPAAGPLGAFMLVASPAVTSRFAPGAIDHHGAQVALTLILLACALRLDRSRAAGIGAGLAAAAMTAIGMETAPHVAVCAAMIALRWAVTGEAARGVALFGLSFAGAVAGVAVATLSPESWSAPVCDTLGAGHIAIAVVGGSGLALATRMIRGSAAARFGALALLALACGAALWLTAPDCLSSPYAALPERLQQDWLAHVREAEPLFSAAFAGTTLSFAIGLPLLVMLAVAVWALGGAAKRETFWRVATACAMFAAAVAVTLWQIRGMWLAFALGGPLLAMAVVAAGRRGLPHGLLALIALSPAALASFSIALANAVGVSPGDARLSGLDACPSRDYAALDRLPRGLVLNPIDAGPFILAFSGQSAVAAPYHRDVAGLMDSLDAFGGSVDAARAVAVSRRAAYVVICPSDGVAPNARKAPDGFSAALLSESPPSWLAPVDLGPGVKLLAFRVLAGRPD